jgi:YHS domain-containing protein
MKRILGASSVLAFALLVVVFVNALGLHSQLVLADTQKAEETEKKAKSAQVATQKPTKDPVCGMEVDPKSAAGKATYKGKTYYFCSVAEKEQFEKPPQKYVK